MPISSALTYVYDYFAQTLMSHITDIQVALESLQSRGTKLEGLMVSATTYSQRNLLSVLMGKNSAFAGQVTLAHKTYNKLYDSLRESMSSLSELSGIVIYNKVNLRCHVCGSVLFAEVLSHSCPFEDCQHFENSFAHEHCALLLSRLGQPLCVRHPQLSFE